jgi:hypothetical protein
VSDGARRAGACAEIALEMQPARAHFAGTPPLLEALETRALVVRHRSAPGQAAAAVRLAKTAGVAA